MIKATMVCTNCKEEKVIPPDELKEAVMLNDDGELNLCSDCRKLWENGVKIFREEREERFADLQRAFGIK